eukprot:CAMPEP_0194219242 /NCGR_PEP_ID=MMETSP0156-20130528/25481_1 /TAXON_ID=33649 /ORGANISM="Thalassionema nitzschioides, Strain L26-B" /LENGTH=392 /DNA_ID=CAMNT_0038948831 /DNA_START=52 /DNA_END=1227 /DNA_ORIENTATION=-
MPAIININRVCHSFVKKSQNVISFRSPSSSSRSSPTISRPLNTSNIRKVSRKLKKKRWSKVSGIGPTPITPKAIPPPPNLQPLVKANVPMEVKQQTRRKFMEWLKENGGIIVLNIGSFCAFLSFTRSDILELRVLNLCGSAAAIFYFVTRPPPLVIAPPLWSSLFVATNLYMAYHIYEERKGTPQALTEEEEHIYEEHFLPHAVTPRQFEKMIHISSKLKLKRGEVLMEKGEPMNKVYLVASGKTEAFGGLSRKITAASSSRGNRHRFAGGDAGAWVGELAFFDYLSNDGSTKTSVPNPSILLSSKDVVACEDNEIKKNAPIKKASVVQNALLTIIAAQDTELYQWDFQELADLLKTSADLRASVTRTMTAAVVGKVVNLYISRTDADSSMW